MHHRVAEQPARGSAMAHQHCRLNLVVTSTQGLPSVLPQCPLQIPLTSGSFPIVSLAALIHNIPPYMLTLPHQVSLPPCFHLLPMEQIARTILE